jgi:hypothetical protein
MKEGGGELIRVEPLHPAATPLMPPLLQKKILLQVKKHFKELMLQKIRVNNNFM